MWLLLLVAAASQPPRRLSLARGDPPPPLNEDPPEEGWPTPEEAQNAFCSVGVVNVNVSNVCLHAVKKLQKCNCTLPESTPMPEDYMNCLNTCVFECNKALSLQLRLGTPIGWKPRKCPRDIFGCTANQTCTKLPPCGPFDTEGCVEMECRPPVARGRPRRSRFSATAAFQRRWAS